MNNDILAVCVVAAQLKHCDTQLELDLVLGEACVVVERDFKVADAEWLAVLDYYRVTFGKLGDLL